MNINSESDIAILSQIYDTLEGLPDASQRDIARKNNMSLGMTNAVLKRFAEKGWVMVRRLSPRKVCYMLTPDGMKLVASRTYHFMQRTFRLMNEYQSAIVKKVSEIKDRGFTKIVLVGQSDIAFLIEYACKECGMEYCFKNAVDDVGNVLKAGEFGVLSEKAGGNGERRDNCLPVMEMVKGGD